MKAVGVDDRPVVRPRGILSHDRQPAGPWTGCGNCAGGGEQAEPLRCTLSSTVGTLPAADRQPSLSAFFILLFGISAIGLRPTVNASY